MAGSLRVVADTRLALRAVSDCGRSPPAGPTLGMKGAQMDPVNFTELRTQFRGSRFSELVAHHLKSQSQDKRMLALYGMVTSLPENVRAHSETFFDRWNARAHDQTLWQTDTATIFDEVITDAKAFFGRAGMLLEDSMLFMFFNMVLMTYVVHAYGQPAMREFMGVSNARFPWASALFLLYPVATAVYMAVLSGPPTAIIGYGLANPGFPLLAAASTVGLFHILGAEALAHCAGGPARPCDWRDSRQCRHLGGKAYGSSRRSLPSRPCPQAGLSAGLFNHDLPRH